MSARRLLRTLIPLVAALTLMAGCAPPTSTPAPTTPPEPPAEPTEETAAQPTAESEEAGLEGNIVIFHAGSLTVPIDELSSAFQEHHPNVTFETEAAGSRTTARKVSELGRQADLIMSADYTVIDNLLVPDFADWNVRFARNTMVIAYTDESRFANEFSSDNWYDILLRDGVIHGHSEPDADPCGYRTLMVWQLAEQYYDEPGLYDQLVESCPPENIRPKSVELIALLESGDMDYAFEYRSVAVQHGLNFVELPEEINLSMVEHADFYSQAEVAVSGEEPGTTITQQGKPIVYGVTIPTVSPSPELAVAFVQFLLGPEGQAIMEAQGQPPIVPAVSDTWDALPPQLQDMVTRAEPAAEPEQVELEGNLVIFHAGSLTLPVDELATAFQKQYPNVTFETEAAGSRTTARKVSELGREADLIMSADYTVIDNLLVPDFADWNVRFARNTMVIAYTDEAVFADEINSDNWYEILLRDGVIHGHSEPDADPCGYRTLMVWQLAEQYYDEPGLYDQLVESCPPENIRPKSVELIALLESGDMDYAFEYRSVAVQHGLNFVELPEEINLSMVEHADFYSQAEVEVSGEEPGETITQQGKPIVYGVTIPTVSPSPELAVEFVRFLLGPEGQAIMEAQGQPPIDPPVSATWEALPPELQDVVSKAEAGGTADG